MALTERLALIVTANPDVAVKGLVSIGKTADRELGKAESRVDRLANRLGKFGAGTLLAGGLAAAGLYKAGQAASELEQAVGGTDSVFKEASGTIDAFAKNSAQSVGLSERAFRQLATVTGASLKGMGFEVDAAADKSVQLVRVGADLAATFGGTTEEAVAALGATLRGEFDPAEKFGIALTADAVAAKAVELGLASSKTQVDANAKAQATLALIMERSQDAQGQFARESDTAAGAQQRLRAELENLQASIGQAVLPVIGKLADGLGDAAQWFNQLNEASGGAVGSVAAYATGALLAVGATASITAKVIQLSKAFKDADGNTTRLGTAMKGVGVGLVGLGIAKALYDINQQTNALKVNLDKIEASGGMDNYVDGVLEARDATRTLYPDIAQLEERFDKLLELDPAAAQQFVDELAKRGEAVGDWQKRIDEATRGQAEAAVASDKHADAVESAKNELTGATGAAAGFNTELKEQFDLAGAVEDQIKGLTSSIDEYYAKVTSGLEAESKFQASLDDLSKSIKDNGNEWDITTEKGRANTDSLLAAQAAILDTASAFIEQGATAQEAALATIQHVEVLKEDMRQAGLTEDQIAGLIAQMGLTPEQIVTTFTNNAGQVIAQLDEYTRKLRTLDGSTITVRIANQQVSQGSRGQGYIVPQLAEGGIVPARYGGTLANIGEGGSAEAVIPLDRLERWMTGSASGGAVQIIVNMPPGSDGQDVVDALVRWQKNNGAIPVVTRG